MKMFLNTFSYADFTQYNLNILKSFTVKMYKKNLEKSAYENDENVLKHVFILRSVLQRKCTKKFLKNQHMKMMKMIFNTFS